MAGWLTMAGHCGKRKVKVAPCRAVPFAAPCPVGPCRAGPGPARPWPGPGPALVRPVLAEVKARAKDYFY